VRTAMQRAAWGYLRPHQFVALCKPLHEPGARDLVPGVTFDLWGHRTLAAWRRRRTSLPVEYFQDEIDGVDTAAVGCAGEHVVGLIWLYEAWHPSRFFRLRRTEVELNYGYVLPEYRRRGVFRSLLGFACEQLGQRGRGAAYAAVHAANAPSLAAFHAAGFHDARTFAHFLVFRPRLSTARLSPAA